ncbi:ZDHHC23 isoform 7, partial [Pan troglodytes]
YNVTEREVQQALRQKTGRRLLCGLIVDTDLSYSRTKYLIADIARGTFQVPGSLEEFQLPSYEVAVAFLLLLFPLS